jgi:hypothetical protein
VEFHNKAYGPLKTGVECEGDRGKEQLKEVAEKCAKPEELKPLSGEYVCEKDGTKDVTLDLKEGSLIYVIPSKDGSYKDEDLPFLDKSKIDVKGADKSGLDAAITIAVTGSGATAEITFDGTKLKNCKGSAKGTGQAPGTDWWVIALIVVAVLPVVVVAVVMLMPSEEDDDDDDVFATSSSEDDKNGP